MDQKAIQALRRMMILQDFLRNNPMAGGGQGSMDQMPMQPGQAPMQMPADANGIPPMGPALADMMAKHKKKKPAPKKKGKETHAAKHK